MATISEDYVSFETAKLLKEKGFNEPCFAYYYIYNDLEGKCLKLWRKFPRRPANTDYLNVPTLQMAMKWLREVHKLHIEPHIRTYKNYNGNIYNLDGELLLGFTGESPEQACEAAIKYCLEYLI